MKIRGALSRRKRTDIDTPNERWIKGRLATDPATIYRAKHVVKPKRA